MSDNSKNLITSFFQRAAGSSQKRKREVEHNSDDDFEEPKKKPQAKPKAAKEDPPKKKPKKETDDPAPSSPTPPPPSSKATKGEPAMKKIKKASGEAEPTKKTEKDQPKPKKVIKEEPPWPELPAKSIKTTPSPPKKKPEAKPKPTLKSESITTTKSKKGNGEDDPDTEPEDSLITMHTKKKRSTIKEEPPWDPPATKTKASPKKPPAKRKRSSKQTEVPSSVEDIEEIDEPAEIKSTTTTTITSAPKKEATTKQQAQAAKAQAAAKPRPRGNWGGGGGMWGAPRQDPPNLGMKAIPKGEPNCLYGKCFLFTGVGDSLQRDDAHALVEHYGGKIVKSVAKACTHAVIGIDAGAKKKQQIEDRKDIVQLDEDGLFDMIRTLPAQKLSAAVLQKLEKARKTNAQLPVVTPPAAALVAIPPPEEQAANKSDTKAGKPKANLWVDKYKPYSTKELVGNPTSITKLIEWLKDWQPVTIERGKKGTGAKNAVLISGPPGVGKTTTAMLVAKELGYTPIEYNASDTRSKKLVKDEISTATSNRSLGEFWQKIPLKGFAAPPAGQKTVLVMDEVDGMSSGDRGGVAELINLIKKTQVPIICLCNDSAHPKMRSLITYCLHLPFKRPTLIQMKPRIANIMQLEGVKIADDALGPIIESVHGDFRQLLHVLQMWSLKSKNILLKDVQQRLESGLKNVELGAFEVIPKLFNATEAKKFSLSDKIDFYFVDSSMVPLLVQDNYINCRPNLPAGRGRSKQAEDLFTLESYSQAAEYISMSDVMSVAIHKEQEWGLSPAYAALSTVAPAAIVSGALSSPAFFPKWLGKFSSQRKRFRLLKEMAIHMAPSTGAEASQLRLDYFRCLIPPLTKPLASSEGIDKVIEFMNLYDITREDWDTVMELTLRPEAIPAIPTNVKTSFTRKYNASHHTIRSIPTRKGASNFVLREEGDEDVQQLEEDMAEGEDESAEDDSVEGDKMIKKKPEGKATGGKGKKKAPAAEGEKKPRKAPAKGGRGGGGKKKSTSDASTESPSEEASSEQSWGETIEAKKKKK